MKGDKEELRLLRALADPTRLNIVKILLQGELCACKLPAMVNRAQPTVSLQLKKLASAGVVSCRKEGVKCIYKISNPKVKKLLEVMQ